MTLHNNEKFSRYVAPNMVTNVIRTVLTALVGLLLVPYYIDELGLAVYGILPLATSVTSYVMVISDAITNAFSRYMVIAIQEGDSDKAGKTYSTTIYGLGKIVLMVLPLVILLSIASPYIFQIGPSSALSVQLMFFMILTSALLVSFSSCYNSIYMAYNKLYLMYICRTAYLLMQVLFVVMFFVMEGARLEYIGVSYVLSAVVFFAILSIIAKRICPSLRVKRSMYDRALLKEMSGLGVWSILSKIGTLMFIQTSLILVNIYMGSAAEGSFAIIASVISMVNTACFSITAALAPLIYFAYSRKNKENLLKIVRVSMRFVTLLLAFPIAYVCIFSPQILTAWVGEEFTNLSDMIFLMFLVQIGVCAVDVLETIPILLLKIKQVAFVTICIGVLNIILAVVMLIFTDLGMMGVAVAWTAAMFLLNFIFIPLYNARILSVPRDTFLKPMIPGVIAFIICLVIGMIITEFFTLPSTWLAVLSSFFVGFLIYIIPAIAFGLDKEGKDIIRGVMPNFIKRLIPKNFL